MYLDRPRASEATAIPNKYSGKELLSPTSYLMAGTEDVRLQQSACDTSCFSKLDEFQIL